MEEKRTMAFPVELRVDTEGDEPPKIRGHAAVFDKLSENLGGFREKIAPGAFSRAIKKDDVRALFNHDSNYILGRTKSNTLTLEEDEKGLAVEIDPPDTQWARDLMVSIKRGDISQMSFGFTVKDDVWEHFEGKDSIRTLKDVNLFDVSPVVFPAYPQTDVKVRSAFEGVDLDFDALSGALFRAKNGTELTETDIQTLNTAIAVFRGYLPDPEDPDAAGHHDDDGVARDLGYQARVREIELIEIS